jgi:hypothetical protein
MESQPGGSIYWSLFWRGLMILDFYCSIAAAHYIAGIFPLPDFIYKRKVWNKISYPKECITVNILILSFVEVLYTFLLNQEMYSIEINEYTAKGGCTHIIILLCIFPIIWWFSSNTHGNWTNYSSVTWIVIKYIKEDSLLICNRGLYFDLKVWIRVIFNIYTHIKPSKNKWNM